MLQRSIRTLFVLIVICSITLPCLALPLPEDDFSRHVAIEKYFKDKPENLIEGIWTTDDDRYEIAIVKNNFGVRQGYDYLGFITQTNDSAWRPGKIILQLKNTAIPKFFIGSWEEYTGSFLIMTDKRLVGSAFRMISDNMIEYTNEKKQKKYLFRIYPTAEATNIPDAKQAAAGTGFFITSDLIVTNNHVVDNAKTIEIVYQNDQKASATVVAKDPANDLALLRISKLEGKIVPLTIGNIQDSKDGDTVYAIGFPLPGLLGTKVKLSEGIINSVTGYQDDVRMFQISIPIQPGNSGSPLLNTKGQVVGVVTSSMNGLKSLAAIGTMPQNVNFAMKINYINNLLATLPEEVHLSVKEVANDLTPGEIMNSAKGAVVQVQVNK